MTRTRSIDYPEQLAQARAKIARLRHSRDAAVSDLSDALLTIARLEIENAQLRDEVIHPLKHFMSKS